MTQSHDHLPYRPGVGMMLLNNAGKVFVGKRIDSTSEAWQMPQGGIDEHEDPIQAALRELEEEVGTRQVDIVAQADDWLTYDLPDHLIPKVWSGRFRGQKQIWFLMRFTGQDCDINIATEHAEFNQWQWIDTDQLPHIIVPFKQALYRDILAAFKPYLR